MRSGSVTKYGRDVALVELHALGELELERRWCCDSSTVMTPSLPTLSNASAMSSPISGSCAEMVATCAMSSLVATSRAFSSSASLTASTAASMPRLSSIGVAAGGDVAQALVDHRLGEHGRGRGAVTGDVVGLGRDLLGELGAEVLVRVVELDLAGDGHAVVGDRGRAALLVDDDVAAARAERHLDGVGERVDAALAGVRRASSSNSQDLGHGVGSSFLSRKRPVARVSGRRGVSAVPDARAVDVGPF